MIYRSSASRALFVRKAAISHPSLSLQSARTLHLHGSKVVANQVLPAPTYSTKPTTTMGVRNNVRPFPVQGLLPKDETQAAAFIRNHPEYDGRGTVIAILDTGVDPGSPGMQLTSDGRPKVIDIIDCTGAGDVPCSTVLEAASTDIDGVSVKTLKALSGRTLKIGDWKNPTGKYRLGIKRSSDLFPKDLWGRLNKERKKKFDLRHHEVATKVHREMEELSTATNVEAEEKDKKKAELKTRLEVLTELHKRYEDPGWIVDCVVFHDGEKWRAALDIGETGDLRQATLLTNYADERQFARWTEDSMLNYSVNIYDEGHTLSVVTLSGTHGNHVAAITAANYPDDPEINGVAPGAQIISLKIGDQRLGSMETGTALVRAAIELARLKPDLANISYGEASSVANTGRFIELLQDDVINKAGCIVVAASGNAGPALSTSGTPGSTTSGIVCAGAYVTKGMMEAGYALLDTVDERPFTWSSRAPTTDGAVGTTIYSPGAAITSVPQYTTARSQLMNGSSMASPNCCGCLALLVGGLKAEGIPYTPYRITAAIQNGGKDINDPSGVKFFQVEDAWEHLTTTAPQSAAFDVHYDISVNGGRGIYLRDAHQTTEIGVFQTDVKVRFFDEEKEGINLRKGDFEVRLALVPSKKWINAPEHVLMASSGRSFAVEVDPTGLDAGHHFGEVVAYDVKNPKAGPLFRVPITVCKPIQPNLRSGDSIAYYKWDKLQFSPGEIKRHFISIPPGANFAELVVRSVNRDSSARFIAHLLQLQPQTRYTKHEHEFAFMLGRGTDTTEDLTEHRKIFPILPNATLEVCLAQFWSSLNTSEVEVEIKLHGIITTISSHNQGANSVTSGSGGDLTVVNAAGGFARLDFWTGLRKEEVHADVSLDTLRRSLRPTEYTITPLKSRDVLPNTRQLHQLVLTYSLKVTDAGTGLNITPRAPRMNEMLYDAWFESFVLIVYDANKKELSYQDIYAKPVKVTDGTYTIRVQLISSSLEELEKLNAMCLVVDQALSKNISLTSYSTLKATVKEDKSGAFKKKTMHKGDRATAWISLEGITPPKDAAKGDLLIGKLNVTGGGSKIDGNGLYALGVIVPPPAEKNKNGDKPKKDESELDETKLIQEAVRDVEISLIKKLKTDAERAKLVAKLETEWGAHLPFLVAHLEQVGEVGEKEERETQQKEPKGHVGDEKIKTVEAAADKILKQVDEKEVREFFGARRDASSETLSGTESDKTKLAEKQKEMDKQKEALALSYGWKAWVAKQRVLTEPSNQSVDALAGALDLFATWIPEKEKPTDNSLYLLSWCVFAKQKGRLGELVKVTDKWLKDPTKVLDPRFSAVVAEYNAALKELGWACWIEYEEKHAIIRKPPGGFSAF
ncbi:subtilase family-domain-containing protein [Fimicolochytrium jonesii]|uniref:subtilase family-domain-containing protein n=1 Tax=Fimicolochytrium jonesii TaxID=1396493 RepID=UPI0022FEA5D2|nr:subtilase family-domain-containing protein [Fimicolochytrium jonesii]KAI8818578.1 subtilase family-domain-containing protein [Fimicolochytrium jonesii]